MQSCQPTKAVNIMDNTIFFEQLPLVLHVKDIESILSISHNTAYALVRSGQIHSIRIGRTYRITREALAEYLLKSS